MSTNQNVPFPNFLIIGAPKCGTTALYHVLKQHPEIYMSPVKEPHYFTFNGEIPIFNGPGGSYFRRVAVTSPVDYLMLFASAHGYHAIGEASPSYLRSQVAATRIFNSLPTAKIIVLLRQPADRAYSHFQYSRANAVEPLSSFSDALEQESLREANGWSPIHFYRQGGFYFSSLSRYFELFPREQIRVYLYEDWNESPEAVLQDLFRFLGVDELFRPEIRRSNVTLLARSDRLNQLAKKPERTEHLLTPLMPAVLTKSIITGIRSINNKFNLYKPPAISPEIRRQLTEGYREDILKLQKLIDRDLSRWLSP